jgi:transcription elongation factor GreA-like protein
VQHLEILPTTHILVRQKTEPDSIEELIKKHPTDLVIEILSQMPRQEATPMELERLLEKILGPTKFKKWWTNTKKLLSKDPRIAIPAKKTDPYILRVDPIKPEEEILEEFYKTAKPLDRIRIATKLLSIIDYSEAIQEDLPRILEELSRIVRENRDLSKAERLQGIWVRNDLARVLGTDITHLEPTEKSMIVEEKELNEIAQSISSSYHKRFLELISTTYAQCWQDIILQLIRSSEGKFTSECMNFLADRDNIELLGQMLRQWLNEQTLKAPVLMWIIKNRHSRRFSSILSPLIEPRLLGAILSGVDYEALQQIGNRRIPLADLLSEDFNLIADLLVTANIETAHDLAQTLLLNQGFEPLTKKSLLARFIKCFPTVQSLVAGGVHESHKEVEYLIVSQKSLDERKREYEILITKKIPENKEAIASAREHGDLRENSEYKMARQDQETLMARKAQLEVELARARVTDFQDATDSQISIGSIVDIQEGSTGKTHRYAI